LLSPQSGAARITALAALHSLVPEALVPRTRNCRREDALRPVLSIVVEAVPVAVADQVPTTFAVPSASTEVTVRSCTSQEATPSPATGVHDAKLPHDTARDDGVARPTCVGASGVGTCTSSIDTV
jgi:hypothetical protein